MRYVITLSASLLVVSGLANVLASTVEDKAETFTNSRLEQLEQYK